MEIKEIGACGVFVVGGAVFGISQFGLNDVLSEDLRHITHVSQQARPAYMDQVVAEFTEAFSTYAVESESYTYVGYSEFTTAPLSGTFIEVVTQESPVPKSDAKSIRTIMAAADFCAQDEMTMFTNKGWTYRFSMTDSKGSNIFAINCQPVQLKLRGVS